MPTVDSILSDISTPISTPYSSRASIAKEILLTMYIVYCFFQSVKRSYVRVIIVHSDKLR